MNRRRRLSPVLAYALCCLAAIAVIAGVARMAGVTGVAPARADNAKRSELLKKADVIARKVAAMRGLAQKRPIDRGVMTKAQIRKRLIERIDDEYSADDIAAEELALQRLGLIPPGTDYKKMVIELLTDQIAGFYDPAERKLYIASWQQTGMAAFDDMLMAHEIDHALQDQHFDLQKFMKLDKDDNDATVARQALVEGDGMALMVEYMMDGMGVQSPWSNNQVLDMMEPQMEAAMGGQLGKVPLVLREGLMFPYMKGLRLVAHFRKHHPWSRIDAIFRKPPLSTEHILHPAKYESYERPDQVRARALPALAGYKAVYDNVEGEAGFTVLLRQHPGARLGKAGDADAIKEKATRAAAGWGGDRVVVYTPPDHRGGLAGSIAVSYSVWDGTADAIEFFEMLADGLHDLSGGGKKGKASATHAEYTDSSGHVFAAQRKDDAVVLIVGAPADKAQAVLEQTWKRWTVRRR